MELTLPIRPEVTEYDLVVRNDYQINTKVGAIQISVHTDQSANYITVEAELFDRNNWRVERKQMTFPMSELEADNAR